MYDNVAHHGVVPLLLRLGLAVIFIYHGLDLVGGEEHHWGTTWNPNLPPAVQALVAWGQLLGGIALGLGFLTRAAAIGIAIIMIGAVATVHWPHGFDVRHGGFEYNFAILVLCAALIVGGGGIWAVDRLFRLKQRT
jgi:putative oxidoreductase